ncbi:MAG: hypothetical protein Q8Q09_10125 [Deltaproteobacteria bacterium]|nr:hypothetical protein [Deltaproteobacteria bacterium]
MRTPRSALLLAVLVSACGAPPTLAQDASRPLDSEIADDTREADGTVPKDTAVTSPDVIIPMMDATPAPEDAPDVLAPPMDSMPPATADYSGNGPLTAMSLAVRNVRLNTSTGCAGNDCSVQVAITVPIGSAPGREAPFPVIVLSNGFQLGGAQYQSYALRAARWGYVVIRWDTTTESGGLPRSIAHRALANMAAAVVTDASATPELRGQLDTRRVVFAGHSRGGKISALAAAQTNAAGLVGFDPVDAPPPGTSAGPDYPSAVTALTAYRGPSAFVGAALGGTSMFGMPCAPTASNYQRFFMAGTNPASEITLANTGHMQFLDMRSSCGLACTFCPTGSAMDAQVRDISQVVLIALAERATRSVDTSAYLTPTGAWLSRQALASTRAR